MTKWGQVYKPLKAAILGKKLKAGESFYTLDTLCEKYNVSKITARRVLRELKLEGLLSSAGRRGTVVTDPGKNKGKNILVCLPSSSDVDNSVYKYFQGFYHIEKNCPFKIFPVQLKYLQEKYKRINDEVVLSAGLWVGEDKDGNAIEDITKFNFLTSKFNPVLIGSYKNFNGIPSVGSDYYKGFYDMTAFVVGKGHKDVAFVSPGHIQLRHAPRFKGFFDALTEGGAPFRPELLKSNPKRDAEGIKQIMNELLSLPRPPSAVICSSDNFALMILDYCEEKGIKVPDDLAVTGYDNIGISSISAPPLTTIDGRVELQSRMVVHLLEKRMGGIDISDEYVKIDPVLVIRNTV
ncbi:MAG: hypothetical protein A2017_05850 [Lentisphaerae bacterium GWF2_44_16]|nr:MAG: hypothetical protein A2017_05850 [Lentisphaerae bacterium GWF2_44_16]